MRFAVDLKNCRRRETTVLISDLKCIFDSINRQSGETMLYFSVVKSILLVFSVTSTRFLSILVSIKKFEKLVSRKYTFITIIINSSIMIKLCINIEIIVNALTRIVLECIEIIRVLLVNISETPTLIKGCIRRTLRSRRLSVMPNFIRNASRRI